MTKKRSKSLFVLFTIILVVCLIATFVNFDYPFLIKGKNYSYKNFVSSLKLGEDIDSGVRVVYDASVPDDESSENYDKMEKNTISELYSIVREEGYKDVTIVSTKDKSIIVTIGNLSGKDDENEIVSLIGNPTELVFSTSQDGSNPFATAKHIKSVEAKEYADQQTGITHYFVQVQFKKEFVKDVNTASKDKTVYMLLGSQTFAQLDYDGGSITEGIIQLQSENITTMQEARTCANQIKMGMFDLDLTRTDFATITPTYGSHTAILLAVVGILFIIAIFAYLIVKYRHLGWIACANLLFFICISLFFLQSIPLVHINLGGVFGLALAMILATDGLIMFNEKAKENYQSDIKFHIAVKTAQKSTIARTLINCGLSLVVGFVCLFMPNMAIQSFGWVMLVTSIVSLFTNQALYRLFVNMYLPFNNTKGE